MNINALRLSHAFAYLVREGYSQDSFYGNEGKCSKDSRLEAGLKLSCCSFIETGARFPAHGVFRIVHSDLETLIRFVASAYLRLYTYTLLLSASPYSVHVLTYSLIRYALNA
jgi:hypothetical protein